VDDSMTHEEMMKLLESFEEHHADEKYAQAMAERLEASQIVALFRSLAQRVRTNEERLSGPAEYGGPHPFRTITPPSVEQIVRILALSSANAVSTNTSAAVGARGAGGAAARVRRLQPAARRAQV